MPERQCSKCGHGEHVLSGSLLSAFNFSKGRRQVIQLMAHFDNTNASSFESTTARMFLSDALIQRIQPAANKESTEEHDQIKDHLASQPPTPVRIKILSLLPNFHCCQQPGARS
jgi:hypothetical protein